MAHKKQSGGIEVGMYHLSHFFFSKTYHVKPVLRACVLIALTGLLYGTTGCVSHAPAALLSGDEAPVSTPSSPAKPTVEIPPIRLSPGDEVRITVHGHPELSKQLVIPPDGRFFYPFAGDIDAAGRSVTELRELIVRQLSGETARVLSAGDELSVQVFRRPEFDTQAIVAQNGMFPVPLAGDIQVIGLTPTEAGERIAEALRRYVREPQVMARVTRYGSSPPVSSPQVSIDLVRLTGERFFVLGEVRVPGVYPMVGRVTLLDAVAAAGGFLREAKSSSVLLIRAGGPGRPAEAIKIDLDEALKEGAAAGMILGRGDVVYVPETVISQVARYTRSISDILRPVIDVETGIWLGQNIDEGPTSKASDTTTRTVVLDR